MKTYLPFGIDIKIIIQGKRGQGEPFSIPVFYPLTNIRVTKHKTNTMPIQLLLCFKFIGLSKKNA